MLVGFIVLAARADAPKTTLPSPAKPGRWTLVVKSGGYDRVANIHTPASYQADGKTPLLLLLHGGGGSGTHALEKDGWAAKAEREGFIVVAPDGLPAAPRLPASFKVNPVVWNSGQLNPRSPRAAIDDVAFIRQLLDELKPLLPHDDKRIYCVGHSNGGGMTLRLAAELSERFAAVGMVAGLLAVDDPKPAKPVPTLYIIGTLDPLVPLAGGEVKTPWGKRQNRPLSELLGKWAAAIGCEVEPVTRSDADRVKTVEYPSKLNGPTLTVMYLEGHGHNWPGVESVLPGNLMGPNASPIRATDVIWEFFKKGADGLSANSK